jgi:hypothetical protein
MADKSRYTSGIQAGTGRIVTVDPYPDGTPFPIVDGDFEIWTDATHLTNWTLSQDGSGGTLSQEATEKKSGSYSAKLTYGTGGTAVYMHKYYDGAAYSGKTLTLGCWIKSANTSPNKVMILLFSDVGGNMVIGYYQNSGGWEYVTTSLLINASATSVQIQVRMNNGVTAPAYFDAISVVVGIAGWDGVNGLAPNLESSNLNNFSRFQVLLNKSVNAGRFTTKDIVSTYSLVYATTNAYAGGVVDPNGDIHFVPWSNPFGQKVNPITGVVSTYSLIYTNTLKNNGGVLASNGDIHFVPYSAPVGQKVSASGAVSTYSLVYTTAGAYVGGVLAPNGDIHFIPLSANRGQKVSSSGVVSTYTLIYTNSTGAYHGGVLAPNGDIHFVPRTASVGQKVSSAGVVSTYSLVYTTAHAYAGGVLAPNGDIYFIPLMASVGQKISSAGVVSTYSLVYTASWAYAGGVLAPNGDIHFIPYQASVGQKVNYITGTVSTYSLIYTSSSGLYSGGVLAPNGDIHFVPQGAYYGQKISTIPAIPFSLAVCCSPFFNKY